MCPVSTIHSPARRCHQRSGSVAGRAIMANSPKSKTAGKTFDRERWFALTPGDHKPTLNCSSSIAINFAHLPAEDRIQGPQTMIHKFKPRDRLVAAFLLAMAIANGIELWQQRTRIM